MYNTFPVDFYYQLCSISAIMCMPPIMAEKQDHNDFPQIVVCVTFISQTAGGEPETNKMKCGF